MLIKDAVTPGLDTHAETFVADSEFHFDHFSSACTLRACGSL